jgi:hypothetical protein
VGGPVVGGGALRDEGVVGAAFVYDLGMRLGTYTTILLRLMVKVPVSSSTQELRS